MDEALKILAEAITNSHMTYEDISKKSGVPKSAIQRYATMQTQKVAVDRVRAICKAIGADTAKIIGWDDNTGYYFNNETAKVAQEMFENPGQRILFDATRDSTPEDLKILYDMAMALKKKERHESDD